jgi:hypothetical protein
MKQGSSTNELIEMKMHMAHLTPSCIKVIEKVRNQSSHFSLKDLFAGSQSE